jgi:hypothetical protein
MEEPVLALFEGMLPDNLPHWYLPGTIHRFDSRPVLEDLGLVIVQQFDDGDYKIEKPIGWSVEVSPIQPIYSAGVDIKDAQGRVQLRLFRNLITDDLLLDLPSLTQRVNNWLLGWRRRRAASRG